MVDLYNFGKRHKFGDLTLMERYPGEHRSLYVFLFPRLGRERS